MPRFPKSFGRRKSSSNALEIAQKEPEVESPSSFKVFERQPAHSHSFDAGIKLGRSSVIRQQTYPLENDENMFEDMKGSRGSGASHTNTISTTDNSSRLSAASTAPSSMDAHPAGEWKSPLDKPYDNIPLPPVPKSSAFSLRNAGRTFSFGRQKPPIPVPPKDQDQSPVSPDTERNSLAFRRDRAVTTSSYASTATPSKFEDVELGGLSLGGDFGDMFAGLAKRKSAILDANANRAMSHSPEHSTETSMTKSYGSNRPNQPSRINTDKTEPVEPPPHSWASNHSDEGLMSNSTPPPPPVHGISRKELSHDIPHALRPGSGIHTGLRSVSGVSATRESSAKQHEETIDEDARILRESVHASRQLRDPPAVQVEKAWSPPHDSMFDETIMASASLAERFQEQSSLPSTRDSVAGRAMTAAQFERYKQDRERMISLGDRPSDDEDDEETYEEEEDDAEKKKELAKQRRKQEAHMAVYRQQMMKVTGETNPMPLRPSTTGSQSSPNLGSFAIPTPADNDEEEDEEIPLGILAAHGFPNKNKPPMQSMGSNPNLRASMMSGAGQSSSHLPVFARKLPEDPYFGASVVNPSYRESLSFGGGSGSVHGGPIPNGPAPGGPAWGVPPGGLVGVIAGEERSRALRRGSPNPQGEYPAQPPGFGGLVGRNSTPPNMYSGMGPQNPMMLSPGDQAQIVMTQQMQQFMTMQLQFMQMMTTGPSAAAQNPPVLQQPAPSEYQRPASQNMSIRQPRAMTMMDSGLGSNWLQAGFTPSINGNGGGYAPSIAPSERSNIGLPGRYRPVSQAPPPVEVKSVRASTMSGALQNWDKHIPASSKLAKKPVSASDDEDDDQAWEEMAKKREKKKSLWKKNKDNNGLREMLNFATQ
ncbi:hypothetical protein B7463_g10857, partial [Scytalidium lignicola]